MLPKVFSPTGDYSSRQRDLTMAYRLLCHAEIEHFIEEAARSVVLSKIKIAKDTGVSSITVMTLLAYYKINWEGLLDGTLENDIPHKTDTTNQFKHPLSKLLDDAAQEYLGRIVSNNHGVRIDNLRRLLKPTGIDFDCIDDTWLTVIDEFGKQRGLTAHTSAVGVTHQIDPKDERDRIDSLCKGLKVIDDLLNKIHKSKR